MSLEKHAVEVAQVCYVPLVSTINILNAHVVVGQEIAPFRWNASLESGSAIGVLWCYTMDALTQIDSSYTLQNFPNAYLACLVGQQLPLLA